MPTETLVYFNSSGPITLTVCLLKHISSYSSQVSLIRLHCIFINFVFIPEISSIYFHKMNVSSGFVLKYCVFLDMGI